MKDTTFSEVAPLAVVTRSGQVESRHVGAVAVVEDGELRHAAGDVHARVLTRSAVKPLQALPLLELGVADRLQLGDDELALVCASHAGTEAHVAVARRLLARGGLGEEDLRCGPHAPFDRRASLAIARAGAEPGRLHNNCSGKHAGFLLLAQELGTPLPDYLDPESRTQQRVRAAVAEMAGLAPAELDVGLDGCGAPTLGMPLAALARAFWRLANPGSLAEARRRACLRLRAAVAAAPAMLAGEGRLPTELVRSAPGRLLPKNGAEGMFAVGVAAGGGRPGQGIAVKVADGAERGYVPVVLEVLRRLGVWEVVPAALAAFARVPVPNTRGVIVGHVESVLPAW